MLHKLASFLAYGPERGRNKKDIEGYRANVFSKSLKTFEYAMHWMQIQSHSSSLAQFTLHTWNKLK